MSGAARITAPDADKEGLWLIGGVNGLVVLADTKGPGHVLSYPSNGQSIVMSIPFADGVIPAYEVLHQGNCETESKDDSMAFIMQSRESFYSS